MHGHQREGDLLVLDALSSLAYQSHANLDGFGLAAFCTDGKLSLVRRPVRAAGDEDFGHHPRETYAAMFLAHVRYADTGEISEANMHPFLLDGRAFAHNGVAVRLRQGDVTWAPGSHDGADIEVPA